jgi:hypothetical protein
MPLFGTGAVTFSGTQFTELSAFDANFSKQTGYTQDGILGAGGTYAIQNGGAGPAVYQYAATPPSANYSVFADIAKLSGSTGAGPRMGVCGRMASGADTMYFALYSHDSTNIRLFKVVVGVQTQLGSSYSYTQNSTPAKLELVMNGSSISVELNDATIIGPVTDTAITAAGRAGVYLFDMRETGVADAGSLDNLDAAEIGGDTTPPTLSSPTGTGGLGVCSGSVSTNEGNGTLFAVATASATQPSIAQIKAGQDHTGAAALRAVSQSVTATGTQTIASGAITGGAGTRFWHFVHTDAASNDSARVSSAGFSVTAAATSITIALKQSDGTTAAASVTAIHWKLLNTATLGAATSILAGGTAESTDASGNLVLDITGLGLSPGDVRYVVAGKSNGTPGADFDGWQGPATAA